MKLVYDYDDIRKIDLVLFISLSLFIVSRKYLNLLSIIYISSLGLYIILRIFRTHNIKLHSNIFRPFVFLFLSLLIIICFSPYSIFDSILTFVFIFIAYVEFYNDGKIEINTRYDVIYIVLCIYLGAYFIVSILNGKTGALFCLPSAWDKNYSGVAMFIFFSYCKIKNRKAGTALALIYAFIIGSRLYQLSIFIVYLLSLVTRVNNRFSIGKKIIHRVEKMSFISLVILVTILFLLMFLVSYLFVKYIPTYAIAAYGESFIDSSNAIRVRANMYAFDLLKKGKLLFYGYGNGIQRVLGVEDDIAGNMYMGFRLVQLHNYFLNIYMRHGLLFAIFYTILLCRLIYKKWNLTTYKYIIPYLIMNLVMHSLLSTTYLLGFLYVISLSPENEFQMKNRRSFFR